MPALEELRLAADRAYLAYRAANGGTYGEINRTYSEARRAYKQECQKQGVKPEIVIRDQR